MDHCDPPPPYPQTKQFMGITAQKYKRNPPRTIEWVIIGKLLSNLKKGIYHKIIYKKAKFNEIFVLYGWNCKETDNTQFYVNFELNLYLVQRVKEIPDSIIIPFNVTILQH